MDRYLYSLKKTFSKNEDVVFSSIVNKDTAFIIFFDKAMTNFDLLEKHYIPSLEALLRSKCFNLLSSNLTAVEEISIHDTKKITSKVFSGFILVYSPSIKKIFAINNANIPSRTPELRGSDVTITGSRDGFIENLDTNIALIRKRIPNENLKYLTFEVGKITKTRIGLTYIDGLCDSQMIEDVKNRIQNLDIDAIYNISHLQGLITNSHNLLPLMTYTLHSDFCCESLLTGRFAVFMDGIPLASIAPVTLNFFTNYADAGNENFWVGFIHRFLLLLALFLGLFLSGLSISVLAYDNEFLPFVMLVNFSNARKGISMNIITEMIVADCIFQIFRIAATRPLAGINQVILLMGSVIIGQITVSAGIISQEVMLISAIAMISSYIVSNNYSFNTSINFLRMIIFIVSMLFGFIGFLLSSLIIIIYIINTDSFGIPLLTPIAPFSFKYIKQGFLSKAYPSRRIKLKSIFKNYKQR